MENLLDMLGVEQTHMEQTNSGLLAWGTCILEVGGDRGVDTLSFGHAHRSHDSQRVTTYPSPAPK